MSAGAAGASPLPARVTAASGATATTLEKLLPRSGDFPGFTPYGHVQLADSVTADVDSDPASIRDSDAAHLRKDGFEAEAEQLNSFPKDGGIQKAQGLAGATEFRTVAGARAYDSFTFGLVSGPSPSSGSASSTRFKRFSVPGVPGARAAAMIVTKQKRSAVNVEWIEGRCLLQIGDSLPSTTPVEGPLIKAAEAIYARTKGACTA